MPAQVSAALIRAAVIALPSGALVFLGALQLGHTLQASAIEGGVALLTTGVARGVFEGIYDAYRAAHGIVKASDIQGPGAH